MDSFDLDGAGEVGVSFVLVGVGGVVDVALEDVGGLVSSLDGTAEVVGRVVVVVAGLLPGTRPVGEVEVAVADADADADVVGALVVGVGRGCDRDAVLVAGGCGRCWLGAGA